jgi:hypothetical protein
MNPRAAREAVLASPMEEGLVVGYDRLEAFTEQKRAGGRPGGITDD